MVETLLKDQRQIHIHSASQQRLLDVTPSQDHIFAQDYRFMKKAESHRALRETYHPAIVTNISQAGGKPDVSSVSGNFFFDKRRLQGAHQSDLANDYEGSAHTKQASLKGPRGNIFKRDSSYQSFFDHQEKMRFRQRHNSEQQMSGKTARGKIKAKSLLSHYPTTSASNEIIEPGKVNEGEAPPVIKFWKNQQLQRQHKAKKTQAKVESQVPSLVVAREYVRQGSQERVQQSSMTSRTTQSQGIIKNSDQIKGRDLTKAGGVTQIHVRQKVVHQPKKSPCKGYAKNSSKINFFIPSARRSSVDSHEGQTPNGDYSLLYPTMGIEGQKMRLQSYLPEYLHQQSLASPQIMMKQEPYMNVQAQQGVQKDAINRIMMEGDSSQQSKQIRLFLNKINQQSQTSKQETAQEKSYFIFSGGRVSAAQQAQMRYKPTPAIVIPQHPPIPGSTYEVIDRDFSEDIPSYSKFDQLIKDAVGQAQTMGEAAEIIIDSNVEHSKSLEKFVNILEAARVKEDLAVKNSQRQQYLNNIKLFQKPIIIKQLLRPLKRHTSGPIQESPISLPSQDDDMVSVQSNGEEKKSPRKKFIVKITTPMGPSQHMVALRDKPKEDSAFRAARQWPLQYSEMNIGGRKMSLQQHQIITNESFNFEELREELRRQNENAKRQNHQKPKRQQEEPWFGNESDRSIQMMKSGGDYL